MSDTIPVVTWTLGQTCKLRSVVTLTDPAAARLAVHHAKVYAKSLAPTSPARSAPSFLDRWLGRRHVVLEAVDGFGVFGDVCVTATTTHPFPPPRERTYVTFPVDGFVLSEVFAAAGGPAGLRDMCRACPANTLAPRPAGCAGTLYRPRNSPDLEELVRSIVARLGLAGAMADLFLPTTPLWYGLWACSPLSPSALGVLRQILVVLRAEESSALAGDGDDDGNEHRSAEVDALVDAINLAQRHDLSLSVSLSPAGHVDMGWSTTFPHCPVCKAEAPVERWQGQFPSTPVTCGVCGARFRPSNTARSERSPDRPGLEARLGRERYRAFVVEYLTANGLSPAATADALIGADLAAADRQRRIEATEERYRQARLFVRRTLYTGLKPVHDVGGDELARFDVEQTTELLRRAAAAGFQVACLRHGAADSPQHRFRTFIRLPGLRENPPEDVLAGWVAEGCRDGFVAMFHVPDDR